MNKIIAVLALAGFGLAACAVVTAVSAAVLQPTVDTSAQKLVEYVVEPDPLGDVLAVREQTSSGSRTWAVVGLAFTALLVGGGVLGYLKLKANKTREDRLLLNMQRRSNRPSHQQRPYPTSRVLPHQPVDELPALPRLPGSRAVSEMEDGYWRE